MRFVTYAATADGDRAGVDRIGADRVGVINGDLIHALPDGTSLIELLGSTLRQAVSAPSPSPLTSSRLPTSRSEPCSPAPVDPGPPVLP